MEKAGVVQALGQTKLLGPARVRAALAANDRLKFVLTLLQTAWTHAAVPETAHVDLRREYAAANMNAPWLLEVAGAAYLEDRLMHLDHLPRIAALLRDDLRIMARPLEEAELQKRVEHWCSWLDGLEPEHLSSGQMAALTGGKRGGADTFHILVMDLHKSLNRLAAAFSDEDIDGAHVWQLDEADRPRIAAFMRGLNRTRGLKFDHPGLDTAATRDGERLLIQNDIGTNDAHVLVIQVEGRTITLTYSDLHDRRSAFFQTMLTEIGAIWSESQARNTSGLNAGADYIVGIARFECADEAALHHALEELAARIVFLIDWNRARKRLGRLVRKAVALRVLEIAAKREVGHMGWLLAGGDGLVFSAMEALGADSFRIGDRLDDVLGSAGAETFLLDAMALAKQGLDVRRSTAQIADEVRLSLARQVACHRSEFAALTEHAAFCHALAEGLRDALAHQVEGDEKAAARFAERAKAWERKADQLVITVRERAERATRWQTYLHLIERADDAADALEDAAFLLSLIAENHHRGWNGEIRAGLQQLADTTLRATQDHVRVLAIASTLTGASNADDQEEFLSTCWRVVNAERQCDTLARTLRRLLVREIDDAATLSLTTDFVAAIESTTDALLRTGYAMREIAFKRFGAVNGAAADA